MPDEVHSTVELLLRYLHGTVMADLSHINRLVRIERNSFMNLDVTAIRNLELVRNMTDGSKRGTLLQVLDFTNTSMGARRLRSWIESPLLDVGPHLSASGGGSRACCSQQSCAKQLWRS